MRRSFEYIVKFFKMNAKCPIDQENLHPNVENSL